MSGSPQYRISKWICHLLQPVLSLYSGHVVKDSFEFVDTLGSHSFPSTFICVHLTLLACLLMYH